MASVAALIKWQRFFLILHLSDIRINDTGMEFDHEVAQLLSDLSKGKGKTTDELIIVLYNELRKLASSKLARERNNITLQTTGLVHEAYLRLLQPEEQNWKSQRHFFGAAAEAMRRILIEHARSKGALKRGQSPQQVEIEVDELPDKSTSVGILDLNEALEELESADHITAELVKLHYFAGLTMLQIAEILNVSPRKADNIWAFAKAWLKRRLNEH